MSLDYNLEEKLCYSYVKYPAYRYPKSVRQSLNPSYHNFTPVPTTVKESSVFRNLKLLIVQSYTYWHVRIRIGTYKYVSGRTNTFRHVQIRFETYEYVSAHTN